MKNKFSLSYYIDLLRKIISLKGDKIRQFSQSSHYCNFELFKIQIKNVVLHDKSISAYFRILTDFCREKTSLDTFVEDFLYQWERDSDFKSCLDLSLSRIEIETSTQLKENGQIFEILKVKNVERDKGLSLVFEELEIHCRSYRYSFKSPAGNKKFDNSSTEKMYAQSELVEVAKKAWVKLHQFYALGPFKNQE